MKLFYNLSINTFLHTLTLAVSLIAAMALSSCGKKGPDFFVEISGDTKGVKPGSSVIYRGTEAGNVMAVTPTHGKFRIEVRLKDEFRDQIKSGATARAVNGLTTQFNPELFIYESGDVKTAPLKIGQQIPEATTLDTMMSGAHTWLSTLVMAGVALGLCAVLVGVLMRGFVKLAIVVAGIALLAVLFKSHESKTQNSGRASSNDSFEELLGTARSILESPKNKEMWQANEADVRELLERAKQEGGKNLEAAKKQLATSIDALKKDSSQAAVRELDRAKALIETFNADEQQNDKRANQ